MAICCGKAGRPALLHPRSCFRLFAEAFGDPAEGPLKAILLPHAPAAPTPWPPGGADARPPAAPPNGAAASPDTYLSDLAAMDDDDFPFPWPKIPVAQGAQREQLREELLRLAKDALETAHRAWDGKFADNERPLSPLERDQAQAAPHPHAELMRREEASCFRQFMRLGTFLLKLQKRAEKSIKNEGSSGYVDENTEIDGAASVTDCSEPLAADAPSTQSEVETAESEVPSPRSEVESAGPPEVDQAAA